MANRLVDFGQAASVPVNPELGYRLGQTAAMERIRRGKATAGDYLWALPNEFVERTGNALVESALSGLTLPGDAMTGKVRVPLVPSSDPVASDEIIRRSLDLTGTMASGTLAVPKGAIGSGMVRRLKPGDKAVKIGDKIYTDPAMHVVAVEKAANDMGYDTLEEAIAHKPEVFEQLDEHNFGEVNPQGQFVSSAESGGSHSDMGSVTYEDYLSEHAAQQALDDDTLYAGGKGSIVPALLNTRPMRSTLAEAVDRIPMKSAPAEQWAATLKNTPGVKSEEMDWTGLNDMLGKHKAPLSKEELSSYLDKNKVQLEEHWKRADRPGLDYVPEDYEPGIQGDLETEAKFHQYQLPGGTNYRELVLTLPQKEAYGEHLSAQREADGSYLIYDDRTGKPASTTRYLTVGAASSGMEQMSSGSRDFYHSSHWDEPNPLLHVRMNDRTLPDAAGNPQRTLFLEEVQSDWHQAGRKSGYVGSAKDWTAKLDSDNRWIVRDAHKNVVYEGHTPEFYPTEKDAINAAVLIKTKGAGEVPDAPFKKTWPDLALKRMVKEAVDHNYDSIAWTDGATQAERYDLSKQISKIEYRPKYNELYAYDHSGHRIIERNDATLDTLPNFIGKEASDKLLNAPTKKQELGEGNWKHTLSGLDLKVGGEGMNGFYDHILPKTANKLFGKMGGNVEQQTLGVKASSSDAVERYVDARQGTRASAQEEQALEVLEQNSYQMAEALQDARHRVEDAKQDGPAAISYAKSVLAALEKIEKSIPEDRGSSTIHVLPITPQMRAAVHSGLPLFSAGVPLPSSTGGDKMRTDEGITGRHIKYTPVDTDPFQ